MDTSVLLTSSSVALGGALARHAENLGDLVPGGAGRAPGQHRVLEARLGSPGLLGGVTQGLQRALFVSALWSWCPQVDDVADGRGLVLDGIERKRRGRCQDEALGPVDAGATQGNDLAVCLHALGD